MTLIYKDLWMISTNSSKIVKVGAKRQRDLKIPMIRQMSHKQNKRKNKRGRERKS